MTKYRFFICYRHKDKSGAADQIRDALADKGYLPFKDTQGEFGTDVTESICREISRAHFFLPLIVGEAEAQSAWVHQEIGYARACNVAVVPIVIEASLDQSAMIRNLRPIEAANGSHAAAQVGETDWESILDRAELVGHAIFDYETRAKHRPELLAKVAAEVHKRYKKDDPDIIVRQRSSLTSFSLPCDPGDENWKGVQVSDFDSWMSFAEREELERVGARFHLMIHPTFFRQNHRKDVQRAKLNTLLAFVKSKRDRIRAVIKDFQPSEGLTVIGNYWALQSATVGPFQEARHSLSTWHPPTVDEYCKNFDREFSRLCGQQSDDETIRQIVDATAKFK